MRRIIRNAIFFVLVVGITYHFFTAPVPLEPVVETTPSLVASTTPRAATFHTVVRVVDGDTITIEKAGERVSVRLIGVDTPETVDPRRPVECFGQAATDEVRRLIGDKPVRIETDSSQGERDTYGRLLAYVYVDDVFINKHLIAEGFGHEYTYIRPYAYQREFRTAERLAEEQQKGLWAPDACT